MIGKSVWICWLVCLLPLVGMAASEPKTPETVIETLSAAMVTAGKFEQSKRLQGFNYDLTSRGRFIFWRDHGLYLETREPFFNATTLTPEAIWYWNADGSISSAQEPGGMVQREVNRTLLAFFSADKALIESRFATHWETSEQGWVLTLTPRLAVIGKHIKSVQLAGDVFLERLQLDAANGDRTILTFQDLSRQSQPAMSQCRRFFRQPDACNGLTRNTE